MKAAMAGVTMAAALAAASGPALARDTLTLGLPLEPPFLDPTAGPASAIREVTYANVFEGLTRVAPDGSVAPALAKSWTISPDGLVYTFALQSGVSFHDGTKFDCSIVRFSYDRAVAPGSMNAQKGLFAPIAETSCPAPDTAVVRLRQPASTFLFNMAWGDAAMVAPGSADTNKTNPIGTGPFRFKQWVKGDRVVLERFPGYWGPKPALATVTFKVMGDPSAATAALLAGDLDAYPNFPAPEALDQFRTDPRFTVRIGTTEGKTILALNDARKPFDDLRVRRALAYAIDRKQLSDAIMAGLAPPIGSHYVPGDPGYVDLTGAYPYDPARARALLKEAGQEGLTLTITLPPPSYARRGGEVIAAMLAQVGVTAKLVPIEWAQWLDQVFMKSAFDATIIAHTEARDLDIYARPHYYFNYHSAAYDALYADYLKAPDAQASLDLVGRLQRQLAADEPNVFLLALPKFGVWNSKLRGLWANDPVPANDVTAVSWSD
jgi:peptide/nickel transport system substrate-binding protein